jgi:hypothetical protein
MAYAPDMSGHDRAVDRYARLALGRFVGYTAEVNAFMPAAAVPRLAWAATAAEVTLGSRLVLGLRVRETIGSAVLLAIFGTAMAISFGPKVPTGLLSLFSVRLRAAAGLEAAAFAGRGQVNSYGCTF